MTTSGDYKIAWSEIGRSPSIYAGNSYSHPAAIRHIATQGA